MALSAIREKGTLSELSSKYGVNANLISRWKQQALAQLSQSFTGKQERQPLNSEEEIKMIYFLKGQGYQVSRNRVGRLMRLMGLCAIYQKPRTSEKNPEHKIYPYLLTDLKIDRSNHVWASDITYIPMKQGFMYMVAILDWHSKKALSWRLSNTMDTRFCLEVLEEVLHVYGAPLIFNTDQEAQFISLEFTRALKTRHIKISMDSKGRWRDNVISLSVPLNLISFKSRTSPPVASNALWARTKTATLMPSTHTRGRLWNSCTLFGKLARSAFIILCGVFSSFGSLSKFGVA